MNDFTNQSDINRNRRYLTFKFCLTAFLVTGLVVVVITTASYFKLYTQGLNASINGLAKAVNKQTSINNGQFIENPNIQVFEKYWQNIALLQGVERGAFFDSEMNLIWQSDNNISLSRKERLIVRKMQKEKILGQILDDHVIKFTSMEGFFGSTNRVIPGLIILNDSEGDDFGVLKVERNYDYIFYFANTTSKAIFWVILFGNMFLFLTLLYNFLRRLRTINQQQEQHNKQISNLSKLLTLNKEMRKNMKTASSRAVELNEQFLRRVGSDLHDGPAQSIGYAVMRLDRVAKDEVAKKFNQDFHVVKEALESSLDEIRGISSGLVLPELEKMTITETLKKVVDRHTASFNTEVTSFLTELPRKISLPIKICAYRFTQEGLNNAHRHGQAEKCRLTAYIKDQILHLSLKDNGMGFRKSQLIKDGGHLGLMGLKDRIESLGGNFSINSELGVGTAIKMSISLLDEI